MANTLMLRDGGVDRIAIPRGFFSAIVRCDKHTLKPGKRPVCTGQKPLPRTVPRSRFAGFCTNGYRKRVPACIRRLDSATITLPAIRAIPGLRQLHYRRSVIRIDIESEQAIERRRAVGRGSTTGLPCETEHEFRRRCSVTEKGLIATFISLAGRLCNAVHSFLTEHG